MEYAKLMFGVNRTRETIAAAAEMKYRYMPERLFKYRDTRENKLDALRGDYLMSSPPSKLNDIFEGSLYINKDEATKRICQFCYNNIRLKYPFLPHTEIHSREDMLNTLATGFGTSLDDVKKSAALYSALQELTVLWDESVGGGIDKIQLMNRNLYNVISLSAVFDNKLMWAHYADQGQGFCVGYDIKSLGVENEIVQRTMPVIYMENPSLAVDTIDELDGSQAMHALSCKSTDWEYEKEWRIFYLRDVVSREQKMPPPKEIYLGPRIKTEDKLKLCSICVEKEMRVFQMEPCVTTNELIPCEVT